MSRSFSADSITHSKWWKNFWNKSSIVIPDTVLEKQWYREKYKFGSTARKGAPPILLQGVWTADNGRLPPWKGDYHHDLNTEMSYWSAYTSNHLEEAESLLDHLDENKNNYRRYTKLFFKSDGVAVPGVSTLNGTEMGGWIQYALSPTVSAWLAQHYYWQWRYGMDKNFLQQRAYPWFKEVARHLEQITIVNQHGIRGLPLSSSPEINNNSINAWFLETTNYDLALMKFVFSKAAELANELQLKQEAEHYSKILRQFGEYAISKTNELMYSPGVSYKESHRHFSHAMAIHPLAMIKWEDGQEARNIIQGTIRLLDSIGPDNWNGYSYSWLANFKARAKDGEGAAQALKIFASAFCSVNSFHVNGDQTKSGYSKRTYRPFTLEGNFGFAAGLQEMLLQSYSGYIEIMPAVPGFWKDVSFEKLRAEGAFLVSAKKQEGIITEIKIASEKGGQAKLKLPFKAYRTIRTNQVKISGGEDGFIQLYFKKGGQVILRNKNLQNNSRQAAKA
jgi:alpha-L-fucosidase 2